MGRQIGFYFAPEDELAMARFLDERDLLCIPKMNETRVVIAQRPSEVLDRSVGLISRDHADAALARMFTPNGLFWHLTDPSFVLQWERSIANATKCDRYEGPSVYSSPGRFYLDTPPEGSLSDVESESFQVLSRVMRGIRRKVRSMCPKISTCGHYYVGPGLARRVERGEAVLYYANGVTPLEMVGGRHLWVE